MYPLASHPEVHDSFINYFTIADEIVTITAEAASRVSEDREDHLSFQEFYTILEQADSVVASPLEGPDPKVVEFLRILEGPFYRSQCTSHVVSIT